MENEQTNSTPPLVGEHVVVTIETLASGGDGIARLDGLTVFVPHAAPGDRADIELTQVTKKFARGRICTVQAPGPDRVPTPCPLADGCPGCQLQHLNYAAQLEAKRTFVRDGLERIGRLSGIDIEPTIGMEHPWAYRNKGEFIAEITDGRVQLGYQQDARFFPLPDCPIQHPLSMTIVRAVEEVATREGLPLAQLITRVSPHENAALAILVCWEWHERLPAVAEALRAQVPELAGVLWARVRGRAVVRRTQAEPLAGRQTLLQQLGRWEYTVSAESFFQINTVQATKLLELADSYAGELADAMFADGYCGVGTFLLPLASRANRAVGIEEHPLALKDAIENVTRYALHDVHLYEGQVETIFARLRRKGRQLDVVLLDPPRKGAGRVVLESLAALRARRVILVSCDPATLGRDAGDLTALGYQIKVVQPVDMFPQTWHIETIVLAERKIG